MKTGFNLICNNINNEQITKTYFIDCRGFNSGLLGMDIYAKS